MWPGLRPVAAEPRACAEEEKERGNKTEHNENHGQCVSLPP